VDRINISERWLDRASDEIITLQFTEMKLGKVHPAIPMVVMLVGLLVLLGLVVGGVTEGLEDQGNKGKGNPGSADQVDLEKTAEMANPPGIPASQIVPGDEDLYILKSQVVPPVCPACPTVQLNGSAAAECPPCPPCARCPEQSFECKKVPNYAAASPGFLPSMFPGNGGGAAPLARLNSFAAFSDA